MKATVTPIGSSAPAHLGAEAAQLWRDLMRDYALDDSAGRSLLLRLCETQDRLRQVQLAILEDGPVVVGSRRQRRANPLLRTEAELSRLLLACYRALRLDQGPAEDE